VSGDFSTCSTKMVVMLCVSMPLTQPWLPQLCVSAGSGDAGHLQYLVGALPECVDELLNDQIDTFETGRFQLNDLLFHDGLKRQVWSEQPRSEDAQRDRGQWPTNGTVNRRGPEQKKTKHTWI